jgi:hypothetical protein
MVGLAFQDIACDKRQLLQRGFRSTGSFRKGFPLFGVNGHATSRIAE